LNKNWKTLYRLEEIDSFRTKITLLELCNIDWNFRFKYGLAKDWTKAEFKQDLSYRRGRNLFHYRILDDDSIQIEEYPSLAPSRTSDWGWQLQNPYAILMSQDPALKLDPSAKNKEEKEEVFDPYSSFW